MKTALTWYAPWDRLQVTDIAARWQYVAPDYDLIILNRVADPAVPLIRGAWRDAGKAGLIYLYANMASAAPGAWPLDTQGMDPGWLLQPPRAIRGYPNDFALNIISLEMIDSWTVTVAAAARAAGCDGVFIDNVSPTLAWLLDPPFPPRYQAPDGALNDEQWQTDVLDFLSRAVSPLRAMGLSVIGNVGVEDRAVEPWRSYRNYLGGTYSENAYTGKAGQIDSPFAPDDVAKQILSPSFDDAGLINVQQAAASQPALIQYAIGCFLVAQDEDCYFALRGPGGYQSVAPLPDLTAARALGQPLGLPVQIGTFWSRQYQGGSVYLETSPTETTRTQVSAGKDPAGNTYAGVATLPPLSALIIVR